MAGTYHWLVTGRGKKRRTSIEAAKTKGDRVVWRVAAAALTQAKGKSGRVAGPDEQPNAIFNSEESANFAESLTYRCCRRATRRRCLRFRPQKPPSALGLLQRDGRGAAARVAPSNSQFSSTSALRDYSLSSFSDRDQRFATLSSISVLFVTTISGFSRKIFWLLIYSEFSLDAAGIFNDFRR